MPTKLSQGLISRRKAKQAQPAAETKTELVGGTDLDEVQSEAGELRRNAVTEIDGALECAETCETAEDAVENLKAALECAERLVSELKVILS